MLVGLVGRRRRAGGELFGRCMGKSGFVAPTVVRCGGVRGGRKAFILRVSRKEEVFDRKGVCKIAIIRLKGKEESSVSFTCPGVRSMGVCVRSLAGAPGRWEEAAESGGLDC